MRTRSLAASAAFALLLGAASLGTASAASAASGDFTDTPATTPISVDGEFIHRTIQVTLAGTITDIDVVLDFEKLDGTCEVPEDEWPAYNDEISFTLYSPSDTRVPLIYSWDNEELGGDEGEGEGGFAEDATYSNSWGNGRVVVTLDDDAEHEAGWPDGLPETGTFRPASPLISFNGEDPNGEWTLEIGDAGEEDPLCYFGATLRITTTAAEVSLDHLVITPANTTVDQGGFVDFTVTGVGTDGLPFDVTGQYDLASSVASDVVTGDRVSFPTASPHTITATHRDSGLTASATVQVIPTAATPPDRVDTGSASRTH